MSGHSTRTVLYPGSFDPFHNGHLDIVEQSVELFGRVIVAVMHNPSKPTGLLAPEARVALVRACVAHLPAVEVHLHDGLAVDAARSRGVDFIVKGLRNAGDFEVEQHMAHTNFSVSGVRTVYLPAQPDMSFVSSRFIREIAQCGGDVSQMVPAPVVEALSGIFGKPSNRNSER